MNISTFTEISQHALGFTGEKMNFLFHSCQMAISIRSKNTKAPFFILMSNHDIDQTSIKTAKKNPTGSKLGYGIAQKNHPALDLVP